MVGGPAITPQINTFNVVPWKSAIIQCVRENDIRGIQTLFDLGAASARDGISLLHYAMFTGCSDVFRLLVQGGASTNAFSGNGELADIITVIWDNYVDAHRGPHWTPLLMENLKNFEQCVAMTQLAIDNDCTIDSAKASALAAGPLFCLIGNTKSDAHASTLVGAIDYLSSIGWDLEEKNCHGQTPLLYAATGCQPQVARCLRALIKRGARLDARDKIGRGPLLTALSPPLKFSNWVDLTYIAFTTIHYDHWTLCLAFATEDSRHVRDYYDAESIMEPLTTLPSPDVSRSNPSLDGIKSRQLVEAMETKLAVEKLLPTGWSTSDFDSDASPRAGKSIPSPVDDDYVYCVNHLLHGVWIRNPSHVLKNRVKTKLKILLEAGCDPNDLHDNGQSPNDYARHGLWSQWLWALGKTGYVFDEEQNRWIKRIDTA